MPLTLLFDLDDTLLNTNLESFVPAYFQALTRHLEPVALPTVTLRALMQGTRLMTETADPTRTLQDVFDSCFYPTLGAAKETLASSLASFYAETFPTLQTHTTPNPEAAPLIEWALSQGYRVAVATDPLFPQVATLQRVRWAGLNPDDFAVISAFEDFHFSKTHPAYFAEMLGRMGWSDGPVVMVGNDMNRDILPAQRLGLKTYHVETEAGSNVEGDAGRGSLAGVRTWVDTQGLAALEPSFRSKEAVLSILLSTPAVIHGLAQALSSEQWRHEPTASDWAMSEIMCHLRDTEREIHAMQLDLMLEKADAFIPRPDTGVWANEREYLNVDGAQALDEFAAARLVNLEKVSAVGEAVWGRRARHAIFGPTDFLEVLGFMADHDRMHIQQAWKTLQNL